MPKGHTLDTNVASRAIGVQALNNRLKDEISRLQYYIHHHVTRWIPCSEQMPKHFPCNYLVWGPGMVRSGELCLNLSGDWSDCGVKITHWMPLPLPPDVMPKTPEFDIETLLKRIEELEAFAHYFLDPEGYGFAVTEEIRNHARKIFGIPAVKV